MNEDSLLVNGKKRLTVQVGIATAVSVLLLFMGFLGGYALFYMDSRNDIRYVNKDTYNIEIAQWKDRFAMFEKTQDEMRGDIKQLLQIPRQVDNLEKRIRYANSVDHPKEYPGGAIADPKSTQ